MFKALRRFFQPWRKTEELIDAAQDFTSNEQVETAKPRSIHELSSIVKSQAVIKTVEAPAEEEPELEQAADSTFTDTSLSDTNDSDNDNRVIKQRVPRSTVTTSNKGLQLITLHTRPNVENLDKSDIPQPRFAHVYHDKRDHIVIAHIARGSAFDYLNRSSEDRRTLKPFLYPVTGRAPFHRTHLIPFGYHGSENDPWLVVGWRGSQNTGGMNTYEQAVKQLSMSRSIIWIAHVRGGTRDMSGLVQGAKLTYTILDPVSLQPLKEDGVFKMQKDKFKWR